MFLLRLRALAALLMLVLVLLSTRAADAQFGVVRQPGGLLNDLVTGVEYDRVNQAKAERHLQLREAKLRRDAEQGRSEAVDRDVRRIENLRYRISIDEWLIRKNSLQEPCFYPSPIRLDLMTCAAIANAARSQEVSYPPQNTYLPQNPYPPQNSYSSQP